MKRLLLIITFVILYINVQAQFIAIINDKDGYVNVRKGKSSKTPIVSKLYKNQLFSFYEDDKSGWVKVLWTDYNKIDLEGFITKNKVFPIDKFPGLQKQRTLKGSSTVYNDSLQVTVQSASFRKKVHRLTFSKVTKENNEAILKKIDGKPLFGTDGEIPREAVSGLQVMLKGKSIFIPKSALDDLYEPGLASLQVFIGEGNTIYIQMDNSDGAGSYTVVWIIKNGQYLKRYIDQSMV